MRGNMEYISKSEAVGRGRGNIFHISEYLGDILFIPQHISEHFFYTLVSEKSV